MEEKDSLDSDSLENVSPTDSILVGVDFKSMNLKNKS